MTDESLTTNSVPQKALSIIIPTWNNATLTRRCIDSLRTNTHHQFNIIWIDNGSSDDQHQQVLSHLEGLHFLYERHPEPLGFAKAVNLAMRHVNAEYCAILHNDLTVMPNWDKELIAAVDHTPGIAGPICINANGWQDSRRHDWLGIPSDTDEHSQSVADVLYRNWQGKFVNLTQNRQFKSLRNMLSFCCVLMPTALMKEIGVLDENFGWGFYADDDYCIRTQERGYSTLLCPASTVVHIGNQTTKLIPGDSRTLSKENLKYFQEKWNLPSGPEPETDQHDIDRLLKQARRQAKENRLADALNSYEQVLKIAPDNPSALLGCANMLTLRKQYGKGRQHYNRLLALDPNSADAYIGLAALSISESQFKDALEYAVKATERAPDMVKAWILAGQVHHNYFNDFEAALTCFETALEIAPEEANGLYETGKTLSKLGRLTEAETYVKQAISKAPATFQFHLGLGNIYTAMDRHQLALTAYKKAYELNRDDVFVLNGLNSACISLGLDEEAIRYGTKSLLRKDKLSGEKFRHYQASPQLDTCWTVEAKPGKTRQNYIAFSLWGSIPTYTQGAIINAELAKNMYPGWQCRFYHDDTVPATTLQALSDRGAELAPVSSAQKEVHGGFWRFFISDDPKVDRFICRDCDSRLNSQEKEAIDQWIESDFSFHLMRDHLKHIDLILAGMWGGKGGKLPNLEKLTRALYGHVKSRWNDQFFLQDAVWPLIKQDCLIHDSFYDCFGSVKFPVKGRLPPSEHVGKCFRLPTDNELQAVSVKVSKEMGGVKAS